MNGTVRGNVSVRYTAQWANRSARIVFCESRCGRKLRDKETYAPASGFDTRTVVVTYDNAN